jgi:hypothetical protein
MLLSPFSGGKAVWGVKQTTYFHVVPRLKTSAAIPSWCAEEQILLNLPLSEGQAGTAFEHSEPLIAMNFSATQELSLITQPQFRLLSLSLFYSGLKI